MKYPNTSTPQYLSRIELSAAAACHNIAEFRRILHAGVKIASVMKGNAYGHGMAEMVGILEPVVDYFQIDDLLELRRLREVSEKPALVLGYIAKSEIKEALALGCEFAIYDVERLETISVAAKELGIEPELHLKLDLFLGRQGVLMGDVPSFLDAFAKFPRLRLAAAYTHFANIEDTGDRAHARMQIEAFNEVVALLKQRGHIDLQTHLSSTSGVLAYERELGLNSIVRVGLGTYGMWPSEMLRAFNEEIELRPVMRWVTHVAQVKTVPAKYPIGYGLTYRTARQTQIAIIPQGYSDGYVRAMSNRGAVLIRGARCRILGRVAMNMFAVDVSHLPGLQPEEEVVLLGRQGEDEITAEQIAEQIGTINYEVTTLVSPLLPRVVV